MNWKTLVLLAFAMGAASSAHAQAIYKTIGPDGKVIYSDKPPALAFAGVPVYAAERALGITFRHDLPRAYYWTTLLVIGLTTLEAKVIVSPLQALAKMKRSEPGPLSLLLVTMVLPQPGSWLACTS